MRIQVLGGLFILCLATTLHLGAGRHGDYDQEARAINKIEKENGGFQNPATGIASGVKEATIDTTTALLTDTAQGAKEDGPIIGTLEGAAKGSGKVLDSAVKGAYKVATLGQGSLENYEVHHPETHSVDTTRWGDNKSDQSDNSMTKVTIKIPGT